MTVVHVRDKELQVSTFTASPTFTTEAGVSMTLEDGTTSLDWDGTVSWSISIIHAPPKESMVHVKEEEIYNTTVVYPNMNLVNESGLVLVNESGYELIADTTGGTWQVKLLHAR